jgi:hypothetical protein
MSYDFERFFGTFGVQETPYESGRQSMVDIIK